MSTPPEWVAMAALTLVRLIVPLALTLLAGYLLTRLDAKWQAAERERRARAGELPARPRCWETKNCDPAKREHCPGYRGPLPCWLAKQQVEGRIPQPCFNCPVFVTA